MTQPNRTRRAGLVAVVMIAPAVLVACSSGSKGPGVAQLGSSAASSSSSSGPPHKSAVAYARCMRAHGLPNFPDPDGNGRFNAKPDLDSPQFAAAQQACKDLLPNGENKTTNGGHLTPEQQAQMLKFARCMRGHGIKNFPDPTGKGMALGDGVDPNSPQFQAAEKACQNLLPKGDGGVKTQKGGS